MGPEGSSSLEILINYLGDSNAEKGCLLDGEVIPQLLEALEGRMEVEGENTDDDDQII